MPPKSLYDICQRRTLELMTEDGYWDECPENPFSELTCDVVNDLFAFYRTMEYHYLRDLELLLSCGKLQRLDLRYPEFSEEECDQLFQLLTEQGCRSITYVKLSANFKNDENSRLEKLIMKCPLLENLHVSTFLNPVVLRNCKRLKSVVINYTGGEESTYFRNQSASTLSVLINLQVLDIFRNKNCSAYFQHIVTMLKNHPRLMSLGQSDSSWAAHHIGNNSKRDAHPQYGLRKCFWGFSIAVEDNPEQIAAYNLMFPEVIRSSILIFPLVVELHIVVRHENCLEHLKILNTLEA
ncbi:uncharacterized protein CDAR_89881 [Caerostris darwini]|uniref:Uncharacterized protein n=1 Tax=Caerostris darwini TaxID=1538125 RepID=A0AAV4TKE2_9ARAC|nr:uncharacterized protein CDAR_89881 [Caerostris darwini]